MIYKTFQYPENPEYNYKFKNGNWYKRKKGSKSDYYVVDADGQKKLNAYFTDKGMFFNYSLGLKALVGVSALVIGYSIFINFNRKK